MPFATAPALAQQPGPSETGYLEALYQSGDSFRAETEILRWLHAHPQDPARPEVELLRAKLYGRAARYAEADVMALSLLDRVPTGPIADDDEAA